MRKLILAALLALLPGAAFACASPVVIKDGAGNSQNYDTVVDGSANCIATVAIGDGTSNANQATVKGASTSAALTDKPLVVAQSPNPSTVCTSVKAVNQTSSTDLVTSTNKLHICSIVLVSATAQSISLIEGTGATCGTGTAALIGGTSASLAAAANGGFSAVSDRAWMVTQVTADHLCLLQSGAGNVSGTITYQDHS